MGATVRLRNQLRPGLVDGALAAVFVVVAQVELHRTVDDGFQAGPMWLNVPLVVLMSAPVAWRRIHPQTALALVLASACLPGLVVAHTIFFWGSMVPMAIVAYSVARHRDGLAARLAWLTGPVTWAANAVHLSELRTLSNLLFSAGLFLVAWLIGRVLRRLSVQSLELASALKALATEQAAREQEAVATERRRITAELHDVVSHSLSLMTIQLGAGRLSLEADAVPVPPQFRAAEETGRSALTELRRALGLMRADAGRDAHASEDLEPLPDLAAVPALVQHVEAAGLRVMMTSEIDHNPPTSIQLTTYRILQEAFTNVLKHAGPVAVEVTVRETRKGLLVEVTNEPGAASPLPTGGGHGHQAMRQRLELFGGTLRVGPRDDGCYGVRALIPVPVADNQEVAP
jgi:signal transduction histidine kinase